MMKKKKLKKNPSNRKPISYSTEFRLDINLNNFVRKLCPAFQIRFKIHSVILCILNKIIQREEIMDA